MNGPDGAARRGGAGAGRRAGGPGAGRERGSASVLVLALAVVLVLVGAVLVAAGGAVVARHRAQSAADLGALAAAQRAPDGPSDACAAARAVVEAVGARVEECELQGVDAVVAVAVDLRGRMAALGPARGSARAGRAGPPPG